MWPLRQNVQYNKHYFFKDIFRVVFVVHLVVLAIFFACDSMQLHQDKFVINSQPLQSTVVFLPLHKNLVQHKKGNSEEEAKNRAVINYDEYEKKVSAQAHNKNNKKIAPVEQQDLKKIAEKKETLATKQQSEKKSLTVLQDEKKSLAAKKAAAEKAEKAKKVAQAKAAADKKKAAEKIKAEKEKKEKALADKKKAEEKKIADKKLQDKIAADKKKLEAAAQKKVEPVVETVVEQVVQETTVQEVVQENSSVVQSHDDTSPLDNSDDNIDLENVTFVGRKDLDSIQIKEQIKAEISKYYRPPVGTKKDLVCELSVLVGKDGKAVRVTIKNSSGSIANDMCARAALLQVDFPKDVIGKEIIVDLGQ